MVTHFACVSCMSRSFFIYNYSGTCYRDHLYKGTTYPKWPLSNYSHCQLNYNKVPLYNDHFLLVTWVVFIDRLHCTYTTASTDILHVCRHKHTSTDSCQLLHTSTDSCQLLHTSTDTCQLLHTSTDSCQLLHTSTDSCQLLHTSTDSC